MILFRRKRHLRKLEKEKKSIMFDLNICNKSLDCLKANRDKIKSLNMIDKNEQYQFIDEKIIKVIRDKENLEQELNAILEQIKSLI